MPCSRRLLLAALISWPLCGCGSGNARLVNDLKLVGLEYYIYHDQFKKGPAGWDELEKNSQEPAAVKRVREAGYQMKWDVDLSSVPGGTSNTVLAEKPGGGPKLMMDGSVKQ
jgi:hypothetical protein